jgi:hypothetical protein
MQITELNKLQFKAPVERILEAYLKTINGIIGFTPKELEIITWLITASETGEITSNTRDSVQTVLSISQFDLNNYISKLKKKGALQQQKDKKIWVNPSLVPKVNKEGIAILIEIYKDEPNSNK